MTANQLRKSILQRAIQGKLVLQDPNDEPASVLLEKIREEKKRLVKEGKIKKSKNESIIFKDSDNCYYEKFDNGMVKNIDEEIPFEIPESWEWVRMGNIGGWGAGATPNRGIVEYYNGDILWLKTGELNNGIVSDTTEKITKKALKECSLRLNKIGDVLIAMYGATIGKLAIVGKELTTNQACCGCTPFNGVYNKYLFYFLMASKDDFVKKGEGGAQPNISREKLIKHFIPLPPLEEQMRIVEKIESIAPKVEEYGKYQIERNGLDGNLPELLKKSILQYAIQGKLVPQNSNDEPVSKLLERIREEKKRLVKDRKVKLDKHESVIFKGADNKYYEKIGDKVTCIEEEIPFQIPENWEWIRLISICSYIQRGKSPKYSDIKKYPVIAQKCNQWDNLSLEKALFIDPESILKYDSERFMQENDILMNSTGTGTIGRTGYFTTRVKGNYVCVVADSHITVIRCMKEIYAKYIYYYLCSPLVQNTVEEKADGSTNQIELNTSTVKSYLIPLPPFEEQKLIVSKIEPLLYKIKVNLPF